MVIELRVVQFWSKIIRVISNIFEITRMILDQIAIRLVQLPLFSVFQQDVVGLICNN